MLEYMLEKIDSCVIGDAKTREANDHLIDESQAYQVLRQNTSS